MALQQSTVTNFGITAASSYIKVDSFYGSKFTTNFTITIFFDVDAKTSGKEPFSNRSFEIDTPTSDMIPALYAHLKTLPEFAGAIDV